MRTEKEIKEKLKEINPKSPVLEKGFRLALIWVLE